MLNSTRLQVVFELVTCVLPSAICLQFYDVLARRSLCFSLEIYKSLEYIGFALQGDSCNKVRKMVNEGYKVRVSS